MNPSARLLCQRAALSSRKLEISATALLGIIGASLCPAAVPPVQNLAVISQRAPSLRGQALVDGSLQQIAGEDLTIGGQTRVRGDLVVPGEPTIQVEGNAWHGGIVPGAGSAQPSNYFVRLQGRAQVDKVCSRTDAQPFATVPHPPAPRGIRDVVLTNPSDQPGDFGTLRDLTVSGNFGVLVLPPGNYRNVTVEGNSGIRLGIEADGATATAGETPALPSIPVYQFQRLALNGNAALPLAGPVDAIIEAGFSTSGLVGRPDEPSWLKVEVASGGASLNGGSRLHGSVHAPLGDVVLRGNSKVHGGVSARRVIIDDNGEIRFAKNRGTENQPPVAHPQSLQIPEDRTLTITLTGSDPENTPLAFAVVTPPQHGALGGVPPNLHYTPAPNYHGPDGFSFTASDQSITSEPADIELTVTPVNDPPAISAGPNQVLIFPDFIRLAGVVTDDDTPTGSALSISWIKLSGPAGLAFGDEHSAATLAVAAEPGTYLLKLEASDADFTVADEVTVALIAENRPPLVNAGADQIIAGTTVVAVTGSVSDDGLPENQSLVVVWQKVSGPGEVAFADAAMAVTTAQFSLPGEYRLSLSASDGAVTASDTVVVKCTPANQPPSVSVAPVSRILLGEPVSLIGTVSDDGIPGILESIWAKESGPGAVFFADSASAATTARFDQAGSYVLRLGATDSILTAQAEVTVTVEEKSNKAPEVDAGADQLAALFNTSLLMGTVSDDALPTGSALNHEWRQASGPAAAVIAAPASLVTAISFPAPGTYVFELAATDGALSSVDSVVVESRQENQAPVVNAGDDRAVDLARHTTLNGTVTDDALPAGSAVTMTWQLESGPGQVTFSQQSLAQTAVTVTADGAYLFRLSATDGDLSAADSVQIFFGDANQPPSVDAGPDQTMALTLTRSENLLANPAAEAALINGEIPGWTEIEGSGWTRGTSALGAPPHEGAAWFYAGATATRAELRQDIDVGAYSEEIDAHRLVAELTLFYRCRDEALADAGAVTLEMLDASERSLGLKAYSLTAVTDRWAPFAEQLLLARGTSILRLGLSSTNRQSDASNDCWFDALSLDVASASSVTLSGTAVDDGIPPGAALVYEWQQVQGPVLISGAGQRTPSLVLLPLVPANYTFELAVSDTRATGRDTVQINVSGALTNRPPSVGAGRDQTVERPGLSCLLDGAVIDDASPSDGLLRWSWTQMSGPAEAVFASAADQAATVWFREAGSYVFRLSATDGELGASDEMTVQVNCPATRMPFDMVLVLDRSAEMTAETMTMVKSVATEFVQATDPLLDRMAVLPFDGSATVTQAFTNQQALVENALIAITRSSSSPNVPGALTAAQLHLQNQARPAVSAERIAVLVTAAPDPAAAASAAQQLKAAGIRLVVVGLQNSITAPTLSTLTPRAADVFATAGIGTQVSEAFHALATMLCMSDPAAIALSAGADRQGLPVNELVPLAGSVEFSHVPANFGTSVLWAVESGPGMVVFADPANPATPATFSASGVYVLKLSAQASGAGLSIFAEDFATLRVGVDSCRQAPPGLVAWWSAEHTLVNNIGALTGTGSVAYEAGKSGAAFKFAAASDHVVIPKDSALDLGLAEAMSIEFWIKPTSTVGNKELIAWRNPVGAYIRQEGQNLSAYFTGRDGAGHQFFALSALPQNAWTHVALTYDKAIGKALIFLNGIQAASFPFPRFDAETSGDLYFAPAGADHYVGALDEISFYNRALDIQEVSDLYRAASFGKCLPDGNNAPVVSAGADTSVFEVNESAQLEGAISDDGFPLGSTPAARWSKVFGPGNVTFSEPAALATSASFDQRGIYLLELEGSDSVHSASDIVEVRVGTESSVHPPAGMVAWWPGNAAYEDSVAGGRLLASGNPVYAVGKVAQGFSFDGIDDYLVAPAREALNRIGTAAPVELSIEFWINPNDVNGPKRYICGWFHPGQTGARAYGITIYQDGNRIGVDVRDTLGNQHIGRSNPRLVAGQWTHVVFLYHLGIGDTGVIIDGVPDFVIGDPLGLPKAFVGFVPDTEGNFHIGGGPFSDYAKFKGRLDEVTVYNSLDAGNEAFALYSAGAVGKCPITLNRGPFVHAGADVLGVDGSALLNGRVSDDEQPVGLGVRTTWEKIDGPGSVVFADPSSPATAASFDTPGLYLLRLSASDSQIVDSDDVEVRIAAPYAAVPSGLVAWWPANAHLRDLVSGLTDGVSGGVGFIPGKVLQGWQFNGQNQVAFTRHRPQTNIGASGSGLSFECWAKTNVLDSKDATLVGYFSWIPYKFGPRIQRNGANLIFTVPANVGGNHSLTAASVFQIGVWQHVAATYDKVSGVARLYVDGVQKAAATWGTFTPDTINGFDEANQVPTGYTIHIGHLNYQEPRYGWNGQLDEVSLYSRALAETELQAIVAAGTNGKFGVASPNAAPRLEAGIDQTVALIEGATLFGNALDDGLPAGSAATHTWSQVSGPAQANILEAAALTTQVNFVAVGSYVFRLAASDGFLSSSDDVVIRVIEDGVNQPPIVAAGSDQQLVLPEKTAALLAEVTDDGVPNALPVIVWSQAEGPAGVSFSNVTAAATSATFPHVGTYILRIQAFDGEHSSADTLEVTVLEERNRPPVIEAGPPQSLVVTGALPLIPRISDDGKSRGYLTTNWSQQAGPAPVIWTNQIGLLLASFSQAGAYTLRLTVSDGEFTVSDDLVLTVTGEGIPRPAVAWAEPIPSSPLPAYSAHSLQVNALPGAYAVRSVLFFADGNLIAIASLEPYAAHWVPTAGGPHVLEAIAVDAVGLTASTGPLKVDVEMPEPSVRLIEPQQGDVFAEARPMTLVAAAFSPSGISKVEFLAGNRSIGEDHSWPYQIVWAAPPAGDHDFRAILTAHDGSIAFSESIAIKVLVPPESPPLAALDSPADGARVTAPLVVSGTASSSILKQYRLLYRAAPRPRDPPESWLTLATGTAAITEGALGTFDPTLLPNGLYEVQLEVEDLLGTVTIAGPLALSVDGAMKLGQFTLAFDDFTLKTPGVPITVTRAYDSREAGRQGDFGHGWRMALNAVRIQTFGALGDGWRQFHAGTNQNFFPYYCVEATRAHRLAVTFPSGRCEIFAAGIRTDNYQGSSVGGFVVPAVPSNCQYLAPVTTAHFDFAPLPGSRGQLRLANNMRAYNPGGALGEITFGTEREPLSTFDPADFVFTDDDGTEYFLSTSEGLRKVRDRRGNELSLDASEIAHSNGERVLFSRDAQNRISALTDPAGQQIVYGYDAAGNLSSVTNRAGEVTEFRYASAYHPHHLTEIINARGVRAVANEYDEDGRLIAVLDGGDNATRFDHDPTGRSQQIHDRIGGTTRHEFDERGNIIRSVDPLGGITLRSYDSQDNETSVTNPLGHTTTRVFDAANNLLSETNPLGRTTTATYNAHKQPLTITDPLGRVSQILYDSTGTLASINDPQGTTVNFTHDALSQLIEIRDALGSRRQFTYDQKGRRTAEHLTDAQNRVLHAATYSYDPNGRLLTTLVGRDDPSRRLNDPTGSPRTFSHTYDAEGRLLTTTGPDGATVTTVYDATGKPIKSIDPLGRETHITRDDQGRETATTFPDGTSRQLEYDIQGRLAATIDPLGHRTQFAYDALNRLQRLTFADGSETTREYDSASRLLAALDERGNRTAIKYDAANRATAVLHERGLTTHYTYDAAGNVTAAIDPTGNTTTFEYNEGNQPVRAVFSDGSSVSRTYDTLGRVVAAADQRGKQTRYEYDPLGRVTAISDALGNVTQYSYDEFNSLVSLTNALGRVTSYSYDSAGRRTQRLLPGGQSESYSYDLAGSLIAHRDFNGFTTAYVYDGMGRLRETHADSAHPSLALPDARAHLVYDYNAAGQLTHAVAQNALGAVLDQQTFSYDLRGRLESKSSPQGTLAYSHDEAGNLTRTESSSVDGLRLSYGYDELNRLISAAVGGTEVATYAFSANGNLASSTTGNDVTHTYDYDALNRLQNLRTQAPNGDVQSNFTYTLDATSRRTRADETFAATSRSVDYAYDDVYRLISESASGGTPAGQSAWSYDAVGNRLSQSSTLPSLAPQSLGFDPNDRLDADSYDANGNTVAGSPSLITEGLAGTDVYDFENRLVRRSRADGTVVDVTYSCFGERIRKRVAAPGQPEVVENYLIDPHNLTGYAQVVEEQHSTGGSPPELAAVYSYAPHLINQRLRGPPGNFETNYFTRDAHGNVRQLTNATGQLTDTFTYDAFGNLVARTGATANLYLHAGEQFDPDLGLYYLRARYVNPTTGRFWTADPFEGFLADPQSQNRYAFGNADPVNNVDPSGYYSLAETANSVGILGLTTIDAYILGGVADQLGFHSTANRLRGFARITAGLSMAQIGGPYFAWRASEEMVMGAIQLLTGEEINGPSTALLQSLGLTPGAAALTLGSADFGLGILPAITKYLAQNAASLIAAGAQLTDDGARVGKAVVQTLGGALPVPKARVFWAGGDVAREAAEKTTTVLGSGADVAPYAGKSGFNVLSMDRTLPLETRKAINRQWLDAAIDRGDDILLKTDPIKWDRFMREIGKESFYNEVELPRLLERGVIDKAILGY
ncbi:MAG: PKD domain-containing protein [Verrucomicrobiales bacterium]